MSLSPPSGSTYTPSEAGNALDLELGAEEVDEESGSGGGEGRAEETSTMEEDRCGGGGGCGHGPILRSLEWVGQIRVPSAWSRCYLLKAYCVPTSAQGSSDLYVMRRSGGLSFIQLRPVPGPAYLRSSRPSPDAGYALALPPSWRCPRLYLPSPLVSACGCSLTPAGSYCPCCGWIKQHGV